MRYINQAGSKGIRAGRKILRAWCDTLINMPSWNTAVGISESVMSIEEMSLVYNYAKSHCMIFIIIIYLGNYLTVRSQWQRKMQMLFCYSLLVVDDDSC